MTFVAHPFGALAARAVSTHAGFDEVGSPLAARAGAPAAAAVFGAAFFAYGALAVRATAAKAGFDVALRGRAAPAAFLLQALAAFFAHPCGAPAVDRGAVDVVFGKFSQKTWARLTSSQI